MSTFDALVTTKAMYLTAKQVRAVQGVKDLLAQGLQKEAITCAKQVMISINPTTLVLPEGWARGHDTHALCYRQAPDLGQFMKVAAGLCAK